MNSFKTITGRFALIVIALCCLVGTVRSGVSPRLSSVTSEDIATLRDLEGLAVSPNGRWATFQVRQASPSTNTYHQAWYVLPTSGGVPRRLADAGEPFLGNYRGRVNGSLRTPPPIWSLDSQWIIYSRKMGQTTQIWRVRVDGRRRERLMDTDGDVNTLRCSTDGNRLFLRVEASKAQIERALAKEFLSGFLFDRRFFPSYSPRPVQPADTTFDINRGRPSDISIAPDPALRLYDFAARRERLPNSTERTEFAQLNTPIRPVGALQPRGDTVRSDAGSLAWMEARNQEQTGGLAPLTVMAQLSNIERFTACLAPACTSQIIRGLWWRNESELIFARGEGTVFADTAFYSWALGSGEVKLILRTPDQLIGRSFESGCAIGGDRLICFREASNHPRQLVALDLVTGTIETLYEPNPEFADFDLGPRPQRLEIHTPSGAETYAYLVLSPHARPASRLPLVVVTYACEGFLRGGVGDEYPVYAIAAQGFAVLCFSAPTDDYSRLAVDDWQTYENWARGVGDPIKRRIQEALNAVIVQLDANGIIETDRIAITGLSYGAETVMYALFNMRGLTAAIASGTEVGPASPFLYGLAGRDLLRRWGLDSPQSERWNVLSVTHNVERTRAALLLNVADHELIDALHPFMALESAGRAVEMRVFPDEYHIKWQPAHRVAIYAQNIDWLNFWLRGVEDEDVTKVAQYARWRAMRERQCELFGENGGARASEELPPWYCQPAPGSIDTKAQRPPKEYDDGERQSPPTKTRELVKEFIIPTVTNPNLTY